MAVLGGLDYEQMRLPEKFHSRAISVSGIVVWILNNGNDQVASRGMNSKNGADHARFAELLLRPGRNASWPLPCVCRLGEHNTSRSRASRQVSDFSGWSG